MARLKRTAKTAPGQVACADPVGQFRAALSAFADLSDREWQECVGALAVETFAAGQLLLRAGDQCERVRFLVTGIARSYFIDRDGREFTWSLHFNGADATIKNRFVIDYASFTGREPSRLHVEAVTDIELVSLASADVERLYRKSHRWATVGRLIADEAYRQTHHRTLSLLTLNAKERYLELCAAHPALLAIAPQHCIASYLGITPQSLSRLRRELSLPNANAAQPPPL